MPRPEVDDFGDATRVEPPRFGQDPDATTPSARTPASHALGPADGDATTRHPLPPRPPSRKLGRTPGTPLGTTPLGRLAQEKPASRIDLQLAQLLTRKRRAIGLSLAQASSLSGISVADIERYEREPGARVPFDHVVVLARVLGIPTSDLPGLRGDGETPVQHAVKAAARALAEPLRVTYSSREGDDRFSGPVDALGEVGEFAIEIGDDSLAELFPQRTVLGFLRSRAPRAGDVVLALHRASSMFVLRRVRGQLLTGLTPEQPNYQLDRSWSILGRAVVVAFPSD
jgi:hypothetical protein